MGMPDPPNFEEQPQVSHLPRFPVPLSAASTICGPWPGGHLRRPWRAPPRFLLRHGRIYTGKSPRTRAWRRWLTTIRFDYPAQQIVLQDYIHAIEDAEERVVRLTRQIEELAPRWSLAPVVRAFQAMRGVAFIVAVTIVAEVGDFTRFAHPRQLMAYLGLVPSEHSSGSSVRRGGITKAGNALARRALIEAAWTYRMPARISRTLHDRLEVQPKAVRAPCSGRYYPQLQLPDSCRWKNSACPSALTANMRD